MTFRYGVDGVAGFNLDGTEYLYKKDILNNVLEVLSTNNDILLQYTYDAWGNCKATINKSNDTISVVNDIANLCAQLNPFTYRSYVFDQETNLYYLNSRYYDPEICRFVTCDDIGILNSLQNNVNGLNLYAYCLNNPVCNIDPSGYFLIGLSIALGLLFAGTVIGSAVAGKVSYDKGNRGWDLVKDIFLGGALGLAAAGTLILTTGVGLGALSALTGFSLTFFGLSAVQMFAIGAVSYNIVACVVAPIYQIEMQPIEFDKPNTPNSNDSKPVVPHRAPQKFLGFISFIQKYLFTLLHIK